MMDCRVDQSEKIIVHDRLCVESPDIVAVTFCGISGIGSAVSDDDHTVSGDGPPGV